MDNAIKAWLFDILSSINEIDSYFEANSKLFEVYQNDDGDEMRMIKMMMMMMMKNSLNIYTITLKHIFLILFHHFHL